MQRRLEQILDPQTLEDPLFGYRKVERHELNTITKGSLIKFKNGNDELRYGGYVVDVKNPNVPVNAVLCLVSKHYWELKYLSCNVLYVKDKQSKRNAFIHAIGKDTMSSALDRVRSRFKKDNASIDGK